MGIRKTIAVVITAAMVMSMTACANNEKPSGEDKTQSGSSATNSSGNYPDKPFGLGDDIPEPPKQVSMWDVLPEIPVTDASAFIYKYDSELGGMVVTDYLRESPKVRIPDKLEGEPVVVVSFGGVKKEITQLVMPDSVNEFRLSTTIKNTLQYVNVPNSDTTLTGNRGYDVLRDCKNIQIVYYKGKTYDYEHIEWLYDAVNLGESGMLIEKRILKDVSRELTKVVIPDSVISIDSEAFRDCTSLTSVTIPDSVTEIGSSAFNGCTSLTSAIYKGKTYDRKHIGELYDAINLGESGMNIKGGILKDVSPSLTEVAIPDGVAIIENAFSGCTNLTSVTLPDSVHTIDNSAFSACKNVKVTYKGKTYNYEQLDDLYNLINYGDSSIGALKVLTYPTKGYTPPFEMSSKGVYMVNLGTDSVVVSQNSNEKLYPNSTTMIMTCLVALENVKDFNAKVNCPYDCFNEFHSGNLNFMGASNVGIEPMQDNLTYWDCINAIMLGSGCEAANIIAYNVGGGSIDNFVDMMNKTAQKIGCKNTHFSNAHGLFDEDNYTTAYDLYLITKYAIDNFPGFTEICNTHQYDMPSNSSNPNGYSITKNNKSIMAGSIDKYYLKNGNAISGTRSLVTTETQNGYTYLIVTLGAPYNSYAYEDHNNLYYWVSDNFEYKRIVDDNQRVTSATVKNGVGDSIDVVTKGALYWLIPKNSELTVNKVMPNIDPILAPVWKGKYVGYLEVRLGEEIIARVPLVTKGVVLRQDADDTSN